MLHAGDAERGGVSQRAFYGLQALLMRERRLDLGDEIHGRVFQRTGGIALSVANDDSAGRIRSLGGDAGQTQRDRVGQGHMAVIAAHETQACRESQESISSLVGICAGVPFGFIPVAAGNPLALWRRLGALRDTASEFLRAGGVIELHAVEREPAIDKMHMRVVEARQQ